MKILSLLSLSVVLLCGAASIAVAAPVSVAVQEFSDDEQAERLALVNDDFTDASPAGPQVTAAVGQALAAAGIAGASDGQAAAVLHGRVTAAWVNSGQLPTNSVSAHFRLVDSASGAVLVEGDASGSGFNNADAATALAKEIVRKIAR